MKKIISVLNNKGGVGKTTTAANLSAGLAAMGKNVLAIDMDGQSNLTNSLGLSEQDDANIYTALRGYTGMPLHEISKNLRLVPSTLDLQAAEVELSTEPGREMLLHRLLLNLPDDIEYVLIDCPPSLGLLTLNALTASTDIIIPVEAEPLALKGMGTILDIVQKVKERLNHRLNLLGILITKYDGRKNLNKAVLDTTKEHFPNKVFKTIIRDNIKLAETSSAGKDIFQYAPKSYGAIDYLALSKEVHKLLKNKNKEIKKGR